MFTTAIASDTSLRDALIDQVHAYVSSSQSKQPFNVSYNPLNVSSISGIARSVPNADCFTCEARALNWRLCLFIYVSTLIATLRWLQFRVGIWKALERDYAPKVRATVRGTLRAPFGRARFQTVYSKLMTSKRISLLCWRLRVRELSLIIVWAILYRWMYIFSKGRCHKL